MLYLSCFYLTSDFTKYTYTITPAIWISTGGLILNSILCALGYTQTVSKQTKIMIYCLNTGLLSLLTHFLYIWGYSINHKDPFGISIPSSLYPEWIGCGVPNTWYTMTFLNTSSRHRWKATLFYCLTILFGFIANRSSTSFYALFFYGISVICFIFLMRLLICIQTPTSPNCSSIPKLSFLITLLYGLFPLTYWFCLFTGFDSINLFFLMSSLVKSCIATLVYQYQQTSIIEGEEQRRRDFVKYIFHELRTPLNSIQIGADLLEESEIGMNLQVSCRYVQETLNNVLYVYSGEENKWKMDISSFSLSHFETQLMQTVKPLLSSKNITGKSTIFKTCPPMISTDMNKLLHICINLWSNAIKYTPENGYIYMDLFYSDRRLFIQIKDTGCGIPPESVDMLFKNFSQLPQGYQKIAGSGLGLSICRQLADFMGGTITLKQSTVGVGSTFEVSIPISFDISFTVHSVSSKPSSPYIKHSFSVLLIDDNLMNLKMLEMLFKKFTDRIVLARNGIQGLECIKNGSFDIIFVDNIMSQMNGPEFCNKLRKELNYNKIIIGLTGNVLQEDIIEFTQAGVDLVLGKPVTMKKLQECLDFVEKNGPTSYWHLNKRLQSINGVLKWI